MRLLRNIQIIKFLILTLPSSLRVSAPPRVDSLLRLPTLGYTVFLPLGYALSRGCSAAEFISPQISQIFADSNFPLPSQASGFPLLPSAAVSQHAGDRSRLAGIGGQKMKRTQARLWKFAFLIATFVQRMRPRAQLCKFCLKNTMLTRSLPLNSPCGLPSAVYLDLSQRSRFC